MVKSLLGTALLSGEGDYPKGGWAAAIPGPAPRSTGYTALRRPDLYFSSIRTTQLPRQGHSDEPRSEQAATFLLGAPEDFCAEQGVSSPQSLGKSRSQ